MPTEAAAITEEKTHNMPLAPAKGVQHNDMEEDEDPSHYPGTKTILIIMTGMYMAGFLVALDKTILATAIPTITDEFNSLGDVGWYGSAYMLTSCAFQLLFGKVYTIFSPKWVYLASILTFEVGSAICGAAPSSTAFIVGRAIAGIGAAGVIDGGTIVLTRLVPLHRRPMYNGPFGAIMGITAVVAPIIGGAFTSNVSWRWCFYLNLPVGGATMLIVLFSLHLPQNESRQAVQTVRERISQLDPLGTLFFVPALVCLILALKWGGTTYAWHDARVIALLAVFGVLVMAFLIIEAWKGERSIIPLRIIKQRSVAAGFWLTMCVSGSMMLVVYYLPLWFQIVQGVSPIESGVENLPLLISLIIASILVMFLVMAVGYYTPFALVASVLMATGAGLLTTLSVKATSAQWIGYQVLYGLGIGFGFQMASLAVQTVLPKRDIPIGVALIYFSQQLGGTIFISVGQNIFASSLMSALEAMNIPNMNPATIVNTGAFDLRGSVLPVYLDHVLEAYNHALQKTFLVGLVMACISVFGGIFMEWRTINRDKKKFGKTDKNSTTADESRVAAQSVFAKADDGATGGAVGETNDGAKDPVKDAL